jgi:hypothetical protein
MDIFIKEQYDKLQPATKEQVQAIIAAASRAGYRRFQHFASEEYYAGPSGTMGVWAIVFDNVQFSFEVCLDESNQTPHYYIDKFVRNPKPSMLSWEVSADGGVSLDAILAKIEEFKSV